jgi:hypothetical protein
MSIADAKAFENRHFFDDLGKIVESYNNGDPQSPSTPGSGDNPSDLFQQQLFQDDNGTPLFNFAKLNGSGDSDSFSSSLPLVPVMGGCFRTLRRQTCSHRLRHQRSLFGTVQVRGRQP